MMTYPSFRPPKSVEPYIPRVFGFKLHPSAYGIRLGNNACSWKSSWILRVVSDFSMLTCLCNYFQGDCPAYQSAKAADREIATSSSLWGLWSPGNKTGGKFVTEFVMKSFVIIVLSSWSWWCEWWWTHENCDFVRNPWQWGNLSG